MDSIHVFIYGLIQGLTEFLPVSSSGHLALLPHFLKIEDPGIDFDLAMHVGTAVSVIIYFRSDIKKLLLQFPSFIKFDFNKSAFLTNSIISTIVTIFFILLLRPFSDKFRGPELIAVNLAFFGLILWVSDRFSKTSKYLKMKELNILISILIGLSQAFAIFPGVSRSGITLTTGRFLNLSKEESTRYSFLLSLPIILGGMVLNLIKISNNDTKMELFPCLLGISISFIVGILTIHFFLKMIKKIGLLGFFIYRLFLALAIFYFSYSQ